MQDSKSEGVNTIRERLKKAAQNKPVAEHIVFGLDLGIASCGWAVIDTGRQQILDMGAHCFDPAEKPKTQELKNVARRQKRGQRRVIRRRAQRMQAVREIIRKHGLLEDPSHEFFQSLGGKAPDPWKVRVDGLDHRLKPEEAAAALIHIAKHRGFKSNSKSDKGTNASPAGKGTNASLSESEKRIGEGTFAQMVLNHEAYQGRRRNRDGLYSHTARRDWIEYEARKIILVQRDKGAAWATKEFEKAYIAAAFFQRDLQGSEHLVGNCPFEPDQKRTAKYAYSFERFRLLQKLVWTEVITEHGVRRHLSREQRDLAMADFGGQKSLTWKALKKKIKLPSGVRFEQVPEGEEKKKGKTKKEDTDVTGSSKGACPGSYLLRKTLGVETWDTLCKTPEKLDRIAEILTFNEALDDIRERFEKLNLDSPIFSALMEATEKGEFSEFKGSGHISAKAARKIIPGLTEGKVYSDACTAAGYEHTDAAEIDLNKIRNAVVSRSILKALKQVTILADRFQCRPGKIHVEFLREIGKSAEERGKMTKGIERRTKEKDGNRNELASLINQSPNNIRPQLLEMYELFKEQKGHCAFCYKGIRPTDLTGNDTQIEHVYPRSRFPDNSFVAKVLACTGCNQGKTNKTPWEWHDAGDFPVSWEQFEVQVKGFTCKPEKKRRLLNKNFRKRLDEDPQFANRHKVDSSYIARLVMQELARLYPEDHKGKRVAKDGSRRLCARPGPLTAGLRRAWLSETMKKVFGSGEKTREDDRHHAVDALTVACCDEGALNRLTHAYQNLEEQGKYKWSPNVEPPWENFAMQAEVALEGWLVCRTESRRARGAGHDEIIRRGRKVDGKEIIYERKSVDKLTEVDLKRVLDHKMIKSLRSYIRQMEQWREKNKSKQEKSKPLGPRSPKGDVIRKVRLTTTTQTVRQINPQQMGGKMVDRRGGLVENTNMVRVDVYHVNERRVDPKGRSITSGYYLVPVYGWQIMDKKQPTPRCAIKFGRPENEWPLMNQDDFRFSLYKDSYVTLRKGEKKKEEVIGGYYRATNRSTASISVSPHNKRQQKKSGQGVHDLLSFRKFTVDRLGRKHEVEREPWPARKSDSCPGVEST